MLAEQFIPDHAFVYIENGSVHSYDGNKNEVLSAGEYYLLRKNHLIKYYKVKGVDEPKFVRLCLEEDFLKAFQKKHQPAITTFTSSHSFIKIEKNDLLSDFIRSLKLIYHQGEIDEAFTDVKQEELLIILMQHQPVLTGILFNYGKPEKINVEEFMNRNYKFNISIEQFAYLTGRSLSAFKRDFKSIFNDTPSRWLTSKRLEEAYFLIHKRNKRPSDIYLDLGFEALSHFSFAFKKKFGQTPTELS